MPVMDEFQEERETLKNASLRKKIGYIWDYYKWPIIIGVVVLIMLVSMVRNYMSRKTDLMYLVTINGTNTPGVEDYGERFTEYCGYDTTKYQITVDTSAHLDLAAMDDATVQTTQKLMVLIAAGDMDCILTDIHSLENYAYQNVLYDMRDFLTDEEYEKYKPFFYYVDRGIIDAKEDADLKHNYDYDPTYPENPYDPTTMQDPVPVGIRLIEHPELERDFIFTDDKNLVVSFLINTKHLDTCKQFLDYLMVETGGEYQNPATAFE